MVSTVLRPWSRALFGLAFMLAAALPVLTPGVQAAPPAQQARGATVQVSIEHFAFAPQTLTIAAGTTVVWTQKDAIAHTVTSDTGAWPSSPLIQQGKTFSMTFTKPGAYTYHCTPHPHMTATIIVTAAATPASASPTPQPATTGVSGGATTVFARGLDNPKGLAFAPNGDLYVAESGHSDGTCPRQTSSANSSAGVSGAVARIMPTGKITRVITGLLSQCEGGQYIGPTGVSFVTQTLYVAQGSCLGQYPGPASPCFVSQPVLRMTPGGAPSAVAQFVIHTLSDQEYGFTHEDPFGIVTGPDSALYVSDGGNNSIWKFRAPATGASWVDKPLAQFPHDPTVTGLSFSPSGELYATVFGAFPFAKGSGRVSHVAARGGITDVVKGLTMPIAVAFSPNGTMYILQYASEFQFKPFPHTVAKSGAVWRRTSAGALETVVSGLNFPTAMAFGPDGKLYITNNGTDTSPGAKGEIVRATVGS